jgi:transposase-like protein DUF772
VFSSRKLERASYDSVAFRFIAANQHPDHDTIAAFRRRFLQEIEGLFVQVLAVAREMGVLKMGTGRHQVHANASRHSALSYEHAGRIEAQLKVADLLAKAADRADLPCRSPMNWRAARSGWPSWPRRGPRSRRALGNASSGSRPSIRRDLRRATPRLRRPAGSPGASRPSRRPRVPYRPTRST